MWRNFIFPCMAIVEKLKISPHVEKFQMSPHGICAEIWNSLRMACVWCRKRCHICKIYAIFAVLSLNLLFTLFCREIYFATIFALLCVEKLSPKVHLWRKNYKYEVWSMLFRTSWLHVIFREMQFNSTNTSGLLYCRSRKYCESALSLGPIKIVILWPYDFFYKIMVQAMIVVTRFSDELRPSSANRR